MTDPCKHLLSLFVHKETKAQEANRPPYLTSVYLRCVLYALNMRSYTHVRFLTDVHRRSGDEVRSGGIEGIMDISDDLVLMLIMA